MLLRDKVAIVTGAGGPGCGRAIARRLASLGAKLVVNDVDPARAREVAESLPGAVWGAFDIGDEAAVRELVALAEKSFGGVDVVVNNASAPYRPGARALADWLPPLRVDLMGAVYVTLIAAEAMKRRGGGAIVHFGSTSALGHGKKPSGSPAYDVAKAGVHRLTSMLEPLARDGVRVSCIVPDWVATPEVMAYVDTVPTAEHAAHGIPARLQTVDEIADAVARLAGDDTAAGRVLVWWSEDEPRLIPWGDSGYAALEPTPAQLAVRWLEAFNRHDVDALMALYADDATHTSPKIRALHPETGGKLLGKAAIAAWWRGALARMPGLRYEMTGLSAGEDSAILEYIRHGGGDPPLMVAEAFDVRGGRIVASRVYHG